MIPGYKVQGYHDSRVKAGKALLGSRSSMAIGILNTIILDESRKLDKTNRPNLSCKILTFVHVAL